MIILGDILDLFNTNIDGYYAGMVINADWVFDLKEYASKLGCSHGYYFNSGLMIVNSKKWREDNIEKKLFEWTKENMEKITFFDQDVFNVVFDGFVKILPEKYNIQGHCYNNEEAVSKLGEKMHIVHYTGFDKPWNNTEMFLSEYFWEYAKISPFYVEMREKHLLQYSEIQTSELDLTKGQLDSTKTEQSEEIAIRQEDIQSLQREVQSLKHEIDVRDARIASIYQSLSWKLTSPLRMVDRWLKIRQ
jgi:lipopolysaccharide biosynthesis glycosyltransferase